jgi:hypothetical protein
VGVASFVIGLIVVVLDLLLVAFALIAGGASRRAREPVAQMAFFFNCFGLLAAFIGLGLGVGGLFKEDRRRTLAVAGAVINGLVILLVTGALLVAVAVWGSPF